MRYFLFISILIFAGCNDFGKNQNKESAVNKINLKINTLRKDGFPVFGFKINDNSSTANKNKPEIPIGHLYAKNLSLNLKLITNTIEFADEHIVFDVKFDYKATYRKRAKPDRGQMNVSVAFSCREKKWFLTKMEVGSLDPKHDLSAKEKNLAQMVREYQELDEDEKNMGSIRYNTHYPLAIEHASKEIQKIKAYRAVWIDLQELQLKNDLVRFFTE